MIPTSKIIAEERATARAEEYIPLFGFADERLFLTTAGEVGLVIRITGTEYECRTPEELEQITRRFEEAIRPFDSDFRLYQYTLKRDGVRIPTKDSYSSPVVQDAVSERVRQLSGLQAMESYMVIVFSRYRQPVTRWERIYHAVVGRFRHKLTGASIQEQVTFAQSSLVAQVDSFVSAMSGYIPMRVLTKYEAFKFFRRLLNLNSTIADSVDLRWNTGLGRQIADTPLEVHRNHLLSGQHYVRVLTLKEPPVSTYQNFLLPLIQSQVQCILTTEFQPIDKSKMERMIRSRQDHFIIANFKLIKEMAAAAIGAKVKEDPEPDRASKDATERLDLALSAMKNDGLMFGRYSMTVVVYDTDLHRLSLAVNKLYSAFGDMGVTVYEESLGLKRQFFSILPGNSRLNRRYIHYSSANYADSSMLFLPQTGEPRNARLEDEYLIPLSTPQHTPYYLNLHCDDIPHAFVCGQTGSGKSFLLNALATHAQKYSPWTFIFDMGGSYSGIARRFGGKTISLNIDGLDFKINPFSLPRSRENEEFVYSLVRLLIESGEYRTTDEDRADLYAQVCGIWRLEPQYRTLSTLYRTTRPNLRPHLSRWVRGGDTRTQAQYSTVFDNTEDTLNLSRFIAFDFQGIEDYKELAEPLLFYLLHRARARVHDPAEANTFKMFVVDECWRFLSTDITRDYIINALKTWRKHNAAMLLATQSPEDMQAAQVERILAETGSVLLLANPKMNESVYQQLFKLNGQEVTLVKRLERKKQFLFKRPDVSRVLQLVATPNEIDLYASTPQKAALEKKGA